MTKPMTRRKPRRVAYYMRSEELQDRAKDVMWELGRMGYLSDEPEMDYEEGWGVIADALAAMIPTKPKVKTRG